MTRAAQIEYAQGKGLVLATQFAGLPSVKEIPDIREDPFA